MSKPNAVAALEQATKVDGLRVGDRKDWLAAAASSAYGRLLTAPIRKELGYPAIGLRAVDSETQVLGFSLWVRQMNE